MTRKYMDCLSKVCICIHALVVFYVCCDRLLCWCNILLELGLMYCLHLHVKL